MRRSLRISLLGPIEAYDGGRRLALGGRRSRMLVALLLGLASTLAIMHRRQGERRQTATTG